MTNLQSLAGSFVWAAVAAVLMLATFEPVSIQEESRQLRFSANVPPAAGQAVL